jgi:hypothetical protein
MQLKISSKMQKGSGVAADFYNVVRELGPRHALELAYLRGEDWLTCRFARWFPSWPRDIRSLQIECTSRIWIAPAGTSGDSGT